MPAKDNPKSAPALSYLFALCPFLLLIFLYLPTLRTFVGICLDHDSYSHGLLMPFIGAYLLYLNLKKQRSNPLVSFSIPGVLLLLLASLFYLVAVSSQLFYPAWISFFLALAGVLLLLFGTTSASTFLPPVILVFLAKPLPDVVLPKLLNGFQTLAAAASTKVLDMIGIPVFLSGNIIEIPGMQLLVEEACSGMRSLMVLVAVAATIMYLNPNRWFIQSLIGALAIVLAIILNVVRVSVTGLLAFYWSPSIAEGFLHSFSGLVTFLIGFLLLYAASIALAKTKYSKKYSTGVE